DVPLAYGDRVLLLAGGLWARRRGTEGYRARIDSGGDGDPRPLGSDSVRAHRAALPHHHGSHHRNPFVEARHWTAGPPGDGRRPRDVLWMAACPRGNRP